MEKLFATPPPRPHSEWTPPSQPSQPTSPVRPHPDETLITAVGVEGEAANINDLPGFGFDLDQLNKYHIATSDEEPAVSLSTATIGAGTPVLSDNNPSLDGVFFSPNPGNPSWVDSDPDFLCGAAEVSQGTSWTGDIALTANNSEISSSSNLDQIYGNIGITGKTIDVTGLSGGSLFFPFGSFTSESLNANVVQNADTEMDALRLESFNLETYLTGLATEVTLGGNGADVDFPAGKNFDGIAVEMCIDMWDMNNDGVVVIDVNVGNMDFALSNCHWIIESAQSKFALIRIAGASTAFSVSNCAVMIGDGICDNVGGTCTEPGPKPYCAGETGNTVIGTPDTSNDVVFSFQNVVLNGAIALDLVSFRTNNATTQEAGETQTNIQNGQGCAQFVGSVLTYSNN